MQQTIIHGCRILLFPLGRLRYRDLQLKLKLDVSLPLHERRVPGHVRAALCQLFIEISMGRSVKTVQFGLAFSRALVSIEESGHNVSKDDRVKT